jgi:hypothetical protein
MQYKYIKAEKAPNKWHFGGEIIKMKERGRGPWYLEVRLSKYVRRLVNLKEYREWTFDDLALASGIGRHSLVRWMIGLAKPSRKNQRKLQRFLARYKI